MKYLDKKIIYKVVEESIGQLACNLNKDIAASFLEMKNNEINSNGKFVLEKLCENFEIAKKDQVPICQDTGTVRILLEIGKNVFISGNIFEDINTAVENAYINKKLRLSVVKDALYDRTNTNNNAPAFCQIKTIDKDNIIKLYIMLKGGGSDNASKLCMLDPGNSKSEIIHKVIEHVKEKATSACPPIILGIGIGGTFESVCGLAQKALFRSIGQHSKNKSTAELENKILNAINATGIGPSGLGGLTAMQVNIETDSCHIASMPMAIEMGCCATRRCIIDLSDKLIDFNNQTNLKHAQKIKNSLSSTCIDEKKDTKAKETIKKIMSNYKQMFDFEPTTIKDEVISLQLPLKKNEIKKLKAGDKVLLSGPIYTLRDAGHVRLLEELKTNNKLPYGLDGQTICYAGPTPSKAGRPFGAFGPTTANRMDFATPKLFEAGVVATIGKGSRSNKIHEACKKTGSVYFCTIGGCAAYLAKCVTSSKTIAYNDLGTEALRKCEIKNMPVFVAIDTFGNDIYKG